MLQVLRDSMKYLAWILWVVIAIFVLFVFVDFGRSSRYGGNGEQPQTAATVGNQAISYREYEHAYRNLEERYRQQLGQQFTPEMAQQMRLPMQALNQLVLRKILLREAARLDLQVSDAELRRYIAAMPLFQDSGGKFVGADLYQRLVRSRLGETPEAFETSSRRSGAAAA
ncbi:MAG TPA: SurA N-terminal domain-containing protein, partial [Thermoanaerobaculia bacterium]|nr:SurA N-terminal domain-containing protein [Thermoanaerobaculia bacterium]